MASTSGTYSFNYSRDQIIYSAARKIGAVAAGETLGASDLQDFADQLNIMVKAWDATGIHIWTETEGSLFLQPNQFSYTLGGTTTDHAATSYTATSLSTGAVQGATAIGVTSIAGISSGDTIGVVLANGNIFWTTVNGAPSGSTVNLTSGLTSAALGGGAVYDYPSSNALIRPLRVVSGRRYNFLSAIETSMDPPMSRLDYRALPNKTTLGVPTRYFYDPRGGANTQGIIYIWPNPSDATNAVNLTWWRPLQDFNTSANIPDLPNEWLNAIIWNLAEQMAIEYDCSTDRFAMVQSQSAKWLDLATGFDREPESYYFGFNADQMAQ